MGTENRDSTEHLLDIFLSGVRVFRDKPFIYEKHAKMFISTLRKEAAYEVNAIARALHSLGLVVDSRVAFCGLAPSKSFWITEWSTLSVKSTAVIIPASFPDNERIQVLKETRCKVAVVETSAEATALAACMSQLPELTHIICFESRGKLQVPKKEFVIKMLDAKPKEIVIHDYLEMKALGNKQADRTADILKAIKPTDTAILFYYHDEEVQHKAIRYTHAHLQAHARVIERLLGTTHTMHETDIVLSSPSWDNPVEHIASCILPVLRDAAIQINDKKDDFSCFENHPHIVIAETAYIDKLKHHIEDYIKHAGWLEWKMFQKALIYGKHKYESADKIGIRRRFFDYLLNVTVIRKVTGMLGGRLRLIVGIDDAASYDTQLFFHTFGVDLVEIPSEIFTVE